MSAGTTPMVAEAGSVADTAVPAAGAAPSSTGWATGPCPVKNSDTIVPPTAGFAGVLTEPSALSTAACPCVFMKTPGAAGCTVIVNAGEITPVTRTSTVAEPGGIPFGTCALIWCAETYSTGAGTPLIVTATSASESGSGVPGAAAVSGASPDPKSEISAPGAMASAE